MIVATVKLNRAMCDFRNIQLLDYNSYNSLMQLTLDIAHSAIKPMSSKLKEKAQHLSSRAANKSRKKNQLSMEKEAVGQRQVKKQKVPTPS